MAATYRGVCIIPTRTQPPGASEPVEMSLEDRTAALNTAIRLRRDMKRYSGGMLDLRLDIIVSDTLILPDDFATMNGDPEQFYPTPGRVANRLGVRLNYDLAVVYVDDQSTGLRTVRGLTTTDGVWSRIDIDDLDRIIPHELMHWFTVYLQGKGYTNFPECGEGEPPAHCAVPLGYPSYIDESWLSDFFQGTVEGGKGIDATGWAVETPTEAGERNPAPQGAIYASPWGIMPPLVAPE